MLAGTKGVVRLVELFAAAVAPLYTIDNLKRDMGSDTIFVPFI
jgi:hypothetical protein